MDGERVKHGGRILLRFCLLPDTLLFVAVLLASAFFFQGGGWNQNAHIATAVKLLDEGRVVLGELSASTGDIAQSKVGIVSVKPIATALAALPAVALARLLTWGVENSGDRVIIMAHLSTVFVSGGALAFLAVGVFRFFRRRIAMLPALWGAFIFSVSTPLFVNSGMLNSHGLAALVAFFLVFLWPECDEESFSSMRLLSIGALLSALVSLEYFLIFVTTPVTLIVIWRVKDLRRVGPFFVGLTVVALIPAIHHTIVFGHPFRVGYETFATEILAKTAEIGLFGLDGFSLGRFFALTFGTCRGIFAFNPQLAFALAVSFVVVVQRRSLGLHTVVIVGTASLIVATSCLVYWHSGSALVSRYLLIIPVLSLPGLRWLINRYPLVFISTSLPAAILMWISAAVTAIPPTPRDVSHTYNVMGWMWRHFSRGELAVLKQPVLQGLELDSPTLPYAYNLGQLLGLQGVWSLLPFVGLIFIVLFALILRGDRPMAAATTATGTNAAFPSTLSRFFSKN